MSDETQVTIRFGWIDPEEYLCGRDKIEIQVAEAVTAFLDVLRRNLRWDAAAERALEARLTEEAWRIGNSRLRRRRNAACPACGAASGEPCKAKSGAPSTSFHASRERLTQRAEMGSRW